MTVFIKHSYLRGLDRAIANEVHHIRIDKGFMRSIFFMLAMLLITLTTPAFADCENPRPSTLDCVASDGGAERFQFTDTEYDCDGVVVRVEQSASAWGAPLTITRQNRGRNPSRIPTSVSGINEAGLDSMALSLDGNALDGRQTSGTLMTYVTISDHTVESGPIPVHCTSN